MVKKKITISLVIFMAIMFFSAWHLSKANIYAEEATTPVMLEMKSSSTDVYVPENPTKGDANAGANVQTGDNFILWHTVIYCIGAFIIGCMAYSFTGKRRGASERLDS